MLVFSTNFHTVHSGSQFAVRRVMTSGQTGNNGIDERSFRFLCDVLSLVETIEVSPKTTRVIEQLVDAAGSIGANREEACASSSRREFVRYNEIALRSARESARWLRACVARRLCNRRDGIRLLDEARQMSRILARIIITTKENGLDSPDPDQAPPATPTRPSKPCVDP